MARIKVSTVLDAPPDVVWADLADISTHVEWMADARAIRFLSPQTSGVGTRFECDTKVGPLTLTDVMEITEWTPGRAMGVTHTGLITGRGRFTLRKARRGRTRFQWKEELTYPTRLGGRFGALVSAPALRWVWKRNLRRLASRF
ncbi:MAG: SRPBCC family protein [Acidimicrobiales bacterium]